MYNDMYNLCNDIRYDIDRYCIKQESDEIFAHTHNISIDDVRLAIKHLKNVNLLALRVYDLIILLFLCYLA